MYAARLSEAILYVYVARLSEAISCVYVARLSEANFTSRRDVLL